MSTITDMIKDALEAHYSAVSVTYGGTSYVGAKGSYNQSVEYTDGGIGRLKFVSVRFATDTLSAITPAPKEEDTCTISGVTYRIDAINKDQFAATVQWVLREDR